MKMQRSFGSLCGGYTIPTGKEGIASSEAAIMVRVECGIKINLPDCNRHVGLNILQGKFTVCIYTSIISLLYYATCHVLKVTNFGFQIIFKKTWQVSRSMLLSPFLMLWSDNQQQFS